MKTTLYMVRHAESPFVFGEERTRGLSEEGTADAVKVADVLEGVDISYIASSHYERAVQTVQSIAERKGLPINRFEALRERAIKGLDYKAPWEDLLKAIEVSFVDLDYALEGGESTREAQQRAIPLIEQLLQDYAGKHVVIGTHGNIMTIIMHYYNKSYGFDFWNRTSKPDIYKMTFHHSQLERVERMWKGKPF
ncbi:histidine phosphatase family protein [Paenibacillus rigui]|uniref:Histidine phosphatase family protein n=1 Tax=Paenibacillus rigui TaxID=554312 RepID=A0A229UQ32_9BACL|nr:histidine phosphatase family protein [Paenibacillus rigui]OXM85596.1 histidine phosphatase family protein [Paenibacillus rigui]